MRARLVIFAVTLATLSIVAVSSLGQQQREPAVGWDKTEPLVAFAGSYSGVTERAYHRIADQEAFDKLWTRHAGESAERDSYGEVIAPVIDFDEFMVLAIFNGEGWNTRSMKLVETADINGELHIRFDANTYQTADLGVTEIVIEGEVTPEKVAEEALRNMDRRAAEREASKHEDPNYTTAYGIFIIPRRDTSVVFIENVQGIIGAPPEWEEKHRLEAVKD